MIKILITLIIALIIRYCYKNGRFISSTTVFCGCYVLIFVIYPLCQTENIWKHADSIDIYALLGIISFAFGLSRVKDKTNKSVRYNSIRVINFNCAKKYYIIVFLVSTVLFIKEVGISRIILVLAGSMSGKELNLGEDIATTWYGYFSDMLIALVMALCVFATNKKEKIFSYIALALYVIFNLLFGFTRIFVISILAMVVIHEIRNMPQRRQLFYATTGATALFSLLVLMNFIRCLGIGQGIDWEMVLDIGYIFESSDFSASYYWLDQLLNIEPPYIRLDTYLKPILYVFIPRTIWPDKPEQTSMQVLRILDPELASTGYSTAGYSVIGEGYAMLGYIGIVIFPFIWGMVCKYFDVKYYQRKRNGCANSISDLYYYIFAIFVILCGQRGDWNQYLIIVIWFYMLPLRLISKRLIIKQFDGKA